MKVPKITIITIVYNDENYIEETIKSVLSQSYSNLEYIIVDGGSTDGTVSVIKKYQDKIDYWVSEPDKGIYYAMNKGIRLSNGEILNMMNSGDCFYGNGVVKIVSEIFKKDNKLGYVIGKCIRVNQKGAKIRCIGGETKTSSLTAGRSKKLCHQAFFYKKELHEKFGPYDTNYKICADGLFMYTVYYNKNINGYLLDKKIAKCRVGGISQSSGSVLEHRKMYNLIFGKSILNDLLLIKYFLRRIRLYFFYNQLKEIYLFLKKKLL